MWRSWTSGLLVLSPLWAAAFVGLPHCGTGAHAAELVTVEHPVAATIPDGGSSTDSKQATGLVAPQKAYDLLAQLQQRNGEPLPGYVGGRLFGNRERRLPPGRYREYDVNRKIPGRARDAERIVIEQRSGRAYYTGDHYRTFTPLK